MIARRPVAGSLAEDDLLVVGAGLEDVEVVWRMRAVMDGPASVSGHEGGVAADVHCGVGRRGGAGADLE